MCFFFAFIACDQSIHVLHLFFARLFDCKLMQVAKSQCECIKTRLSSSICTVRLRMICALNRWRWQRQRWVHTLHTVPYSLRHIVGVWFDFWNVFLLRAFAHTHKLFRFYIVSTIHFALRVLCVHTFYFTARSRNKFSKMCGLQWKSVKITEPTREQLRAHLKWWKTDTNENGWQASVEFKKKKYQNSNCVANVCAHTCSFVYTCS